MADEKALAYLDGGPASGLTVQLDEPEWAPLHAIRIDVAGVITVYVRAHQRPPGSGQPWRYVPKGSPGDESELQDQAVGRDPYDD